MARSRKAAFDAYYQALPQELKSLHMFFRVATEYHQMHRSSAPGTTQERRWAREELEGHVFTGLDPQPALRRCEQILATDRARRVALVRERQRRDRPAPLRVSLTGGWGEVVPFPGRRQAAERADELAAIQA
ncbi:MAG: hypothetical protein INR70_00490 [Parafilimonas terrae]|nr:hypothetical protein [Parafilimonas terrae]